MNTKLYVGNLSPSVSEGDLRTLFSRAGSVTEVTVALDPVTHQSRGFGFVTMATPELAAAALRDFHGYDLGGRNITVTEARQPQERKGLMSEGFELCFQPVSARRAQQGTPVWAGAEAVRLGLRLRVGLGRSGFEEGFMYHSAG